MKPRADKVEHELGDFVRRRLKEDCVGQVIAIIFHPAGIGYRIQWEDAIEEHHSFEIRACPPPDETAP